MKLINWNQLQRVETQESLCKHRMIKFESDEMNRMNDANKSDDLNWIKRRFEYEWK